jgi:hypothetical protein
MKDATMNKKNVPVTLRASSKKADPERVVIHTHDGQIIPRGCY